MTQPCKICNGTGTVPESELMEEARKVRARLKEEYEVNSKWLLRDAITIIDELRDEVNTLRNKQDKIRRMFE